MLNITEEIHTKLGCDYCAHYEIELYINGKTSYDIEYTCGQCGHHNKYSHSSSQTPPDPIKAR